MGKIDGHDQVIALLDWLRGVGLEEPGQGKAASSTGLGWDESYDAVVALLADANTGQLEP